LLAWQYLLTGLALYSLLTLHWLLAGLTLHRLLSGLTMHPLLTLLAGLRRHARSTHLSWRSSLHWRTLTPAWWPGTSLAALARLPLLRHSPLLRRTLHAWLSRRSRTLLLAWWPWCSPSLLHRLLPLLLWELTAWTKACCSAHLLLTLLARLTWHALSRSGLPRLTWSALLAGLTRHSSFSRQLPALLARLPWLATWLPLSSLT
jgi:hypothetical protein